MDPRAKKIIIIASVIFIACSISAVLFYALSPKLPSTQFSDKTVILDNYSKFTTHISPDSFGSLGNYLYEYIEKPTKGVYHATISEESYEYSSQSWFSKFNVVLDGGDAIWKVSVQTLKDGSINGDIGITCVSGALCRSVSSKRNSSSDTLQIKLPISTTDYIISYQSNDVQKISIVYYDQEGTGKTKALEKIKSLGFKPEDYTIEYFYGGR